ncbi:predicted protein [Thalassiosira pseudonana CCMP1335]|uniref:Alpha-type protein kinase domain-containing protein n=1 Tax=Thalassiosira pseudonana TaxID=35128 RepID=B8BR25_THAPS|nr:predicted protein [Thalassiosira pseudonana CCMP1335]EED96458.1 predicted protein [Thalassiosira pseudonana CCMP1335]|eukprot:scaffold5185_cov198-Alexandrium_tamarense.AAC.39
MSKSTIKQERKRPPEEESLFVLDYLPVTSSSSSSPYQEHQQHEQQHHHPRIKAQKISDTSTSSLSSRRAATHQQEVVNLEDSDDEDEIEVVKTVKNSNKTVHFNEIEHEVYYFKPYPVEQLPEGRLGAIDEHDDEEEDGQNSTSRYSNNSSMLPLSSEHSRATADFTLISTHHGRARRNLRNISKRDLRAAIKYGQKMPAHPDRHTGEPRWKFLYNNIVYITSGDCRTEITSYVETIKLEKVPVSAAQTEHHIEVKRILKEEPHLCTGHTYIIFDQSGSMRENDVNGFKTRSHAAYGTLALDFISEQISQRGPNQDNLFAESVTVVEMRDKGEILQERQPFDWILFNRLISRPDISRPSWHGNYNDSLRLVQGMILLEHHNLLKGGVEPSELPNFSLVFLSDGRPSDSDHQCAQQRIDILRSLADTLQSKFSLYALGIGKRDAEFATLASMVETVKNNGGMGQFVHAGLSAVTLSSTFSAISSTMTSHRTTLLTGANDTANGVATAAGGGGADSSSKQIKDFTMRETGKVVGMNFPVKTFVHRKGFDIKRYRFNKDLYKRETVPWKDVGFMNHNACGFEMETKPFGKGAERLAYRFNEIQYDTKTKKYIKAGNTMVAKNSILANEEETRDAFHKDFCRVQSTSYDLAEKFNDVVRKAPLLQALSGETRPPELKFMLCHVYSYKNNQTDEESSVLVEKELPGKFTKYNSNNGYVKTSKEGVNNTRTIELNSGKVRFEEFVQAFSHWVYVHTNNNMLVCDIQGVLYEEGRYPQFLLTDPAICTSKSPRFGKTDMQLKGIRNFCRTHKCGIVCRGLRLPCMSSSKDDLTRP